MIRHKNGKNKPLYIGGQKYDGSKTVVVELAPDKSEYKNFFLTYIAGYDEYKLVFCPVDLENMVPLETHIYSDEDCTVEIALITEIVEGTNDVKVLYPDGKQAIFLFSNTKETNGLVDFETMKDYVADYVEEHGGGGGGAIEQPLYIQKSPTREWQQYDGTQSVNLQIQTAFNLLSDERGEIEYLDDTEENYNKPWVLFSIDKNLNNLNISNGKCKFYLQFGISETIFGISIQYDCFITIDIYNNCYTIICDGAYLMQAQQPVLLSSIIYVYTEQSRYYVVMLPLMKGRKFNLYGNVNARIEKTYINDEDFNNLNFIKDETLIQTTPSGDPNHLMYINMGASWYSYFEIYRLKQNNDPTGDLGWKPYKPIEIDEVGMGAWYINGMLIRADMMKEVLSSCFYYLGNPNLNGDFINNFSGITNFGGFRLENQDLNDCFMNITSKAINVGFFKPRVGNNFLLNSDNVEYIEGEIDLSAVDPDHDLDFFMGANVKYATIKNFPRTGVFPNKIFKTWENISLQSFDALIHDVYIFKDVWDLHVSEAQIDRLVSESSYFTSRESFIYECLDTHSVNIIVDTDLGT